MASSAYAGPSLPRNSPETQGVDSSGIVSFVGALEAGIDAVHSFMLVRHGKVVAEGWWAPYQAEDIHVMYSATKSFNASAIGFAADEGLLDVDDRVVTFFPKITPKEPADYMSQIRVRDLLSMNSGHANDMMDHLRARDGMDWTACFLETEVEFPPGTHFRYNSAASYMLAAIVQKVTGMSVEEYLKPRLFDPLGIDARLWGKSAEGVNLPGGLSVTTEELARFGMLYLNGGVWEGTRLLSEHWVTNATSWQTASGEGSEGNWDQGYGFQFWRNKGPDFRADGSLGQFCFVFPELDTVLAMTSGTSDMNGVMNIVWEHLVPALRDEPLPANTTAADQLSQKLDSLSLSVPVGAKTSPMVDDVFGKVFAFEPNDQGIESVRIDFSSAQAVVTITDADGAHEILCGLGTWVRGRTGFKKHINELFDTPEQGIAAVGAWTADDVFTVKFCFNETPYILSADFHFERDRLLVNMEYNVRWDERKQKPLTGTFVGVR